MKFVVNLPCENLHPLVFQGGELREYKPPPELEGEFSWIYVPVGELDYEVRIPYCGCYRDAKERDILESLGEIIGTRFLFKNSVYLPPIKKLQLFRWHWPEDERRQQPGKTRVFQYGIYREAIAESAYQNAWEDFTRQFSCYVCGANPTPNEVWNESRVEDWGRLYNFVRDIKDRSVLNTIYQNSMGSYRCCSVPCWIALAHKLSSLHEQQRKDRQCLKQSRNVLKKLRKELRQPSPSPDVLLSLREELRQQTNSPNSCPTSSQMLSKAD